jgi:hypothetical protein
VAPALPLACTSTSSGLSELSASRRPTSAGCSAGPAVNRAPEHHRASLKQPGCFSSAGAADLLEVGRKALLAGLQRQQVRPDAADHEGLQAAVVCQPGRVLVNLRAPHASTDSPSALANSQGLRLPHTGGGQQHHRCLQGRLRQCTAGGALRSNSGDIQGEGSTER